MNFPGNRYFCSDSSYYVTFDRAVIDPLYQFLVALRNIITRGSHGYIPGTPNSTAPSTPNFNTLLGLNVGAPRIFHFFATLGEQNVLAERLVVEEAVEYYYKYVETARAAIDWLRRSIARAIELQILTPISFREVFPGYSRELAYYHLMREVLPYIDARDRPCHACPSDNHSFDSGVCTTGDEEDEQMNDDRVEENAPVDPYSPLEPYFAVPPNTPVPNITIPDDYLTNPCRDLILHPIFSSEARCGLIPHPTLYGGDIKFAEDEDMVTEDMQTQVVVV